MSKLTEFQFKSLDPLQRLAESRGFELRFLAHQKTRRLNQREKNRYKPGWIRS